MRTHRLIVPLLLFLSLNWFPSFSKGIFIETESFENKGGWVLDQQFMDEMGSPYLLAHGLGKPVDDASTEFDAPESGVYHIYARTYNWTAPWHEGKGPGVFTIGINGKTLGTELGCTGEKWMWQYAGKVNL